MNNARHELMTKVAQKIENTPYLLTPTAKGFDLKLDVANNKWWGLLGKRGFEKVAQYRVELDEENRVMTITDDFYEVQWEAGGRLNGGIPKLVARKEKTRQLGRVHEVSFSKSFGISEQGKVGVVQEYTFNSSTGRNYIREAAQELGWSEKRGAAEKIGIVFGIIGGAGAAITLIGLAVAALTGQFA